MASRKRKTLKLTLLENAFDYLNAGLEYLVKANRDKDHNAWKFAILNLTFAIELMMKERLRRANPILIYAELDRYRPVTRETKTVSWSVLIERLRFILKNDFDRLDAGRLNLAQRLRNQMLHYDTVLTFPEAYNDFANILNFLTSFYANQLQGGKEESIEHFVKPELLIEEDSLDFAFREEIVFYNETFMAKAIKDEIMKEQKKPIFVIENVEYKRFRYGSPEEVQDLDIPYFLHPCHDCGVVKGQLHQPNCDMEVCPKCKHQLLSCECDYNYPDEKINSNTLPA